MMGFTEPCMASGRSRRRPVGAVSITTQVQSAEPLELLDKN